MAHPQGSPRARPGSQARKEVFSTMKLAAIILAGAVIVIPPRGHDNITLGGPDGPTFGFRGDSDTTVVITPHGPIYDFDEGHGDHITINPNGSSTFTFGDD